MEDDFDEDFDDDFFEDEESDPIIIPKQEPETVEETPDTMITLTSGKKIIVTESRQEVKELVRITRKDVFSSIQAGN